MPKFKSPDGRVFDAIAMARAHYCRGKQCVSCPPYYVNRGRKPKFCDNFVTKDPIEAASLMGYEVIEDDCNQIATKRNSEAMTIEQYQQAAARTATGKCCDLANAGLGLTGEAGEVADIIKKHLYQGHGLPQDKIVEELGDLMWYVALTASLIGVDLKAVMQANIEKLWRRYPNGFRPEDSVHREDEK